MDLSDLNEEQRRAVLAPIRNILVSAGAGSGKTLVLTNRIVNQLINEHISISSFLILTFTEAAAKEMKNRIKNARLQIIRQFKKKKHFTDSRFRCIVNAYLVSVVR